MERGEPMATDLHEYLSAASASRLEQSPFPQRVEPMLAKLSHQIFSDPDWIFERKLDGERCIALTLEKTP